KIVEITWQISTIFTVEDKLKYDIIEFAKNDDKLNKAKARTQIIEHLVDLSQKNYIDLSQKFAEAGFNWGILEKSVLIRSIDTLWVEHLEAMASVRQGIGLRGYGQRDPLIEYKKEAYRLYNELNNLIHKEVVYSIYKLASANISSMASGGISAPSLADRATQFSAPAKTADAGASSSFSGFQAAMPNSMSNSENNHGQDTLRAKAKNKDGKKIGRNDPCPCGSGKKYKKCCGG
ncbi:MAG: SEC-C metal-binding domain-containing protein, partial [Patescibacteria group bacterium]|nr:SEC-C metal-binding domain-containing protein [Patescibacteria group bacterium]